MKQEYPGMTPKEAVMSIMSPDRQGQSGTSSGAISVSNEQAPANVTPHTPDAGDQYYIGDCYNRALVSQEWELDTSNMPYLAHIKSLSNSWKQLRHLADWMEVGTTPLRWLDVKAKPKQKEERWTRTKITLMEYSSTGKTYEVKLDTANALKEAVYSVSEATSEAPVSHLFFVEDLSQQVIEMLGSRFDIDPLFFREQIADYNWFNTRDPWAMAPNLMAGMKHRSWFRMRHVRFRYMEDRDTYDKARLHANGFNVFRRPDDDETHWSYLDKPGSLIAMTRTRTSIWVGKDPKNPNVKVAIVLVDPTVTEGQPLWGGSVNWNLPPSMHDETPSSGEAPQALYDLILQATSSYPWFPSPSKSPPIDEHIFALPTLYTICADWLVICEYLKARLSQIDWELEKPSVFRSKGDIIDSSLRRLHVWRRVIPVLREMVGETIDQALPAASRLVGGSEEENAVDAILPDFKRVRTALNELQNRVDRLTDVVASEISTEDSRRGLEENHNLARLTWLATTFIPLSYVTGFFSMTDDITSMKETYGWYFAVAIPLSIITMVIAGGVGRGWLIKPKAKAKSTAQKAKKQSTAIGGLPHFGARKIT